MCSDHWQSSWSQPERKLRSIAIFLSVSNSFTSCFAFFSDQLLETSVLSLLLTGCQDTFRQQKLGLLLLGSLNTNTNPYKMRCECWSSQLFCSSVHQPSPSVLRGPGMPYWRSKYTDKEQILQGKALSRCFTLLSDSF